MELRYAELSVAGPCASNQDCVGFWQSPDASQDGALAVLADGVGSLGSGDIASRLAVSTGLLAFRESRAVASLHRRLLDLINAANWAVYDKGFEQDGPGHIATTVAVAAFGRGEIVVGNVGDSRVYLARNGGIQQLSVDHSLVAMQRRFGRISEEESRTSAHRHVITRGLGVDPQVRADVNNALALPGDRVVLCSDGLYDCVTDEELASMVAQSDPAAACRELVALAEARETRDNISVQIIAIESL